MNSDAEGRRLQRQNSIHEAPVRDTQDMCVQTHAQAGIEMSMRFFRMERLVKNGHRIGTNINFQHYTSPWS